MEQKKILTLQGVTKAYERGKAVLRNLNLTVQENEIVAIVGNSGSGKTTLLRVIAGLESIDDGQVIINDRVVTARGRIVSPSERSIGYIFQEHALFPHMTVRDNIEFGLRAHPAAQKREIADQVMSMLQISPLAHRYPHQISGGQTQRVGIARALAPRPRLLLLDEPFNNLDIALREEILPDLHAILKRYATAALCITHLPQEAFALADRIAVLDRHHIAQIAEPPQLYRKPVNRDIAQFFGLINCIPARYSHREQLVYINKGVFFIPAADSPQWKKDIDLNILLRPDELELFFNTSAQECKRADLLLLHGKITHQKYFGYFQLLNIHIAEPRLPTHLIAHAPPHVRVRSGHKVLVGLPMSTMHIVAST